MAESQASKTQAARNEQSTQTKRATLAKLKGKKRTTHVFSIYIGGEELTLKFQSIGAVAYDKLVSKHPPKAEQRMEGASFNMETFAPALISACSVEPDISPEDALEIWQSDDWSRGDLMVLFSNAVELNNRGIDIPFNESVSD